MSETEPTHAPNDQNDALLRRIRALGQHDPEGADADCDRARVERCAATFVELPDGDFIEIYYSDGGTYTGFIRSDGITRFLNEATAHAILTELGRAGFPVD